MSPPRAPRVLVNGLDAPARHLVREVARLLGAEVIEAGVGNVGAEEVGKVDLVLVGGAASEGNGTVHVAPAAPTVVVGPSGSMSLPGDEAILAEMISSVKVPRDDPVIAPTRSRVARPLVLAVAGWEGGVGATTLARGLAGAGRSVLVDASGSGAGVLGLEETRDEGIHWADLDPEETRFGVDLMEALPRVGGIPVLAADGRGGVSGSDPRLTRVLRGIAGSTDIVVDLGRWDDRAVTALVGGMIDAVCLVGRGNRDSAVALSASIAMCPPTRPVVVAHTGASHPLLGLALDAVGQDVPVWRFRRRHHGPRPRETRRLWDLVRQEESHRWMSSWSAVRT